MLQVFTYRGRLGRLSYFGKSLGVLFVALVAAGIVTAAAIMMENYFLFVLLLPIWFAAIGVQALLGIRRLHDLDLSGWWYLPCLVAILVGGQMANSDNAAVMLFGVFLNLAPTCVLLFKPGTDGANRFGSAPVASGEAAALSPT